MSQPPVAGFGVCQHMEGRNPSALLEHTVLREGQMGQSTARVKASLKEQTIGATEYPPWVSAPPRFRGLTMLYCFQP